MPALPDVPIDTCEKCSDVWLPLSCYYKSLMRMTPCCVVMWRAGLVFIPPSSSRASLAPEIITQKPYSFKTLPGPLSPAPYWLTLTYWSNPFLIICIATWLWLTSMSLTSVCLIEETHGVCLTAFFLLEICSVYSTHLRAGLSKGQGSFFI